MFIIGGWQGAGEYWSGMCNDVWKSADGGSTWELISKPEPIYSTVRDEFDTFPPRYNAAAAVLNGKIYLVGGTYFGNGDQEVFMNDVWVSEDGVEWKHIAGTPLTQDEYGEWVTPE
ncbi:MAG TPA: kelch-like protein [Spirochaetia bacterium]|nr:kelch-like protein [Spirochaetia bacterium]